MAAPQAAADYVDDPSHHVSPPRNPTSIDPVEADGVHKVAIPDSQPHQAAHGTNHKTLNQRSDMPGSVGGAYK